jgi:hypothetical protein
VPSLPCQLLPLARVPLTNCSCPVLLPIPQDLFWHVQRSSSSSTSKQPLLRAGWLAFLTIKAQLLPGFPDLVRCTGANRRVLIRLCLF